MTRKGFGQHLLVKNLLQFSLAVTCYWLTGYAFSFGDTKSEFVGEFYFGGDKWLSDYSQYHGACFSYNVLVGIFVIFIINNAIVEKVSYVTYIVFPICLMLFIWPAAVAWSWGNGWLYDVMDQSMIDYGGSVTIYSFAGAFGFVGTLFTGRRPERYANEAKFSIINVEIYVLGWSGVFYHGPQTSDDLQQRNDHTLHCNLPRVYRRDGFHRLFCWEYQALGERTAWTYERGCVLVRDYGREMA